MEDSYPKEVNTGLGNETFPLVFKRLRPDPTLDIHISSKALNVLNTEVQGLLDKEAICKMGQEEGYYVSS